MLFNTNLFNKVRGKEALLQGFQVLTSSFNHEAS